MKNRGFTLIEVLIVLIIIGILATLVMPQLTGMVERARTAEARTTLGAIRTALMADNIERADFPATPAAADTAGLETALGELVATANPPDAGARFHYTFVTTNNAHAGGTVDECKVYAERNTVKWQAGTAAHSCLKMIIYSDGQTSEMGVAYIGAGAVPPVGGDATPVGVAAIEAAITDAAVKDPY